MVTKSKKTDDMEEDGEIIEEPTVIEIDSSSDSRKASIDNDKDNRKKSKKNRRSRSRDRSKSKRSDSKEKKRRRRSRSNDRIEERRLEREKAREKEKEAERQRDRRRREREEVERKRRDEDRRREAERRRRMAPSPTFRKRSRSRERLTSREEREVRRKERHNRKKSDAFKGSLSEGQRKIESSDEELKDVEIPMDSDDEEAQIRKRREARQKMLKRIKGGDKLSPNSSPRMGSGSPLLDRFKEKNRISSKDSGSTPKSGDDSDAMGSDPEGGIDDILAAALRDDLDGLNNEDLESALKEKLLENKHKSIDAKPITEDFWDTENDMFAESFSPGIKNNRLRNVNQSTNPILQDNWTDAEGYFRISVGELLDKRYKSYAFTGKGVFSNVIRCKDQHEKDKDVAIKIIRKNDLMLKAGLKEVELIQRLNEADPDDRYHCLRMHRSFTFKQHLCLVFEPLAMNLRDVVKKYGSGVGLHVKAVRSYSQQLFLALKLLKKCQLLHADIKPDNILVNESKSMLKLCDFGSGTNAKDAEITPYLVSRFYRAPEIIMGCPYEYGIDLWSVAVSIFEIATGKIMLPGRTNNHMLKLMQDYKGKFPKRMVRRAAVEIRQLHFNHDIDFLYVKKDKLTGQDTIQTNSNVQKTKDLKSMLVPTAASNEKVTPTLQRKMAELCDLIEKCTALDPSRRASINDCLSHSFIVEKIITT
jgi:serine/threonine-protein kinase PRP4